MKELKPQDVQKVSGGYDVFGSGVLSPKKASEARRIISLSQLVSWYTRRA